jgi:hypothetical protein
LPEAAVFVPALLDAGVADVCEFLMLAYFALLLGCSIGFAVKVGVFSAGPRRPVIDGSLNQTLL